MELSMIRTMEVILAPNTGYMALTSAMFALGLGGIYLYLFPVPSERIKSYLGKMAIVFAVAAPTVILVFNLLPFGFEINQQNLLVQILCWAGMYLSLVLPFFAAGLSLALIFQTYSKDIDRLYFFDLIAAGCACLIFIPLMPGYGPGGIIFIASAASLVAYLCFSVPNKLTTTLVSMLAVIMVAIPLLKDGYIEFDGHANKRGNDEMIDAGKRIMTKWDPVSKLDIIAARNNTLLFSIDGGTQGSWLGKFDGNFSYFDRIREEQPETFNFGRNSIVHYFADSKGIDPEVLIIGSSAGGETKGALAFGAKHVDAVELVGAIIDSERNEFNDFGGGIYNHPNVSAIIGEGRSFLRSTDKQYDIIQMFSNHSSSSITQGSTAAGVAYLQTLEAYLEYFSHLTDDGLMQINHHIYPRMLTTAAQAWHQSGRKDFYKHALVIEPRVADTLPTLLINMKPWTQDEIETVISYVNRKISFQPYRPVRNKPSERFYGDKVFEAKRVYKGDFLNNIQIVFGTYSQNGLPYNVEIEILKANGEKIYQGFIPGEFIQDNDTATAWLGDLTDVNNEELTIRISAPKASEETSISVWLNEKGEAVLTLLPGVQVASSFIAFNPLDDTDNIIRKELLHSPFPQDLADQIPWDISPVTDYSPFFTMIRKNLNSHEVGKENSLDTNTAYLLNAQLNGGYPKDWIHLIVVAAVSLAFSVIFIVLPILKTSMRKSSWSGMSRDIIYFACLGLGFIMLQVVFIQLFHKLIGFPVHTFVLVISTMLLCAGLGSMYCQRFLALVNQRTWIVFAIIVLYGIGFILLFEPLFYFLLAYPLPIRLLCGGLMIAPVAFFMGMPFPIGILGLSKNNAAAIPWAWALNGFFTVLGGYLAIVISIFTSFIVVLSLAFFIYFIAMLVARKNVPINNNYSKESEPLAAFEGI